MPEQEVQTQDPRSWIGSAIALVLTAAIVIAVFWQTRGTGSETPPPEISNEPPRFDRITASIEETGDGTYRVSAGPMVLGVAGRPATTFDYRMRMYQLLDDDSRVLASALRLLTRDPEAQKAVNATPEQLNKIYELQPPRMVATDAEREHIQRLWAKWEQAPEAEKPAAQQALLDAVAELSKNSIVATRKAWVDAGAELKRILTLQQMAKLAVYEQANGLPPWTSPPSPNPATQLQ